MSTFTVYCEDNESGHVIEAVDHETAAEQWAEWEDRHSADYWIVGGEVATVCVKDHHDGSERKYRVSGRGEPVYTAIEIFEEKKA